MYLPALAHLSQQACEITVWSSQTWPNQEGPIWIWLLSLATVFVQSVLKLRSVWFPVDHLKKKNCYAVQVPSIFQATRSRKSLQKRSLPDTNRKRSLQKGRKAERQLANLFRRMKGGRQKSPLAIVDPLTVRICACCAPLYAIVENATPQPFCASRTSTDTVLRLVCRPP